MRIPESKFYEILTNFLNKRFVWGPTRVQIFFPRTGFPWWGSAAALVAGCREETEANDDVGWCGRRRGTKSKRTRTAFSAHQLLQLDDAFRASQYLVGPERRHLATALNLTETQVHNTSVRPSVCLFHALTPGVCYIYIPQARGPYHFLHLVPRPSGIGYT